MLFLGGLNCILNIETCWVFLKNGLISSLLWLIYLSPLYIVISKKSTLEGELSYVNFIV